MRNWIRPVGSIAAASLIALAAAAGPASAAKPIPGDIDKDGQVGCSDQAILLANWGAEPTKKDKKTLAGRSDLNRDGIVDITDLSIMLSNWTEEGTTC